MKFSRTGTDPRSVPPQRHGRYPLCKLHKIDPMFFLMSVHEARTLRHTKQFYKFQAKFVFLPACETNAAAVNCFETTSLVRTIQIKACESLRHLY